MQNQSKFSFALLLLLLVTVCPAAIAQTNNFRARLSEVPVTPLDYRQITGVGEVFATLNGSTLTVTGTFKGLTSVATRAHIHSAPKAMNGPPVQTLEVTGATSGEISGTVELSAEQVAALRNESLYIMVHSEAHPGGVIRGWLLPRKS